MGPQHPSTHGVLRMVVKLDGETVREVIPVLGYIHRGIEKMGESFGYRQFVHMTDRIDYLSALINNWAVSMTVEKAAKIELNDRIQIIRTIMAELQRIQSHQLWWGVFGMDMGAFTPFLYGFRDREIITDIFEETIGARLTMNYIQPGGLMFDIHPNFQKRVKDFLKYFKPKLEEYETLLSGNVILQERVRNVGIMDAKTAISIGATGPVLRASGVKHDLRKLDPYGVYDKVDFDVPVGRIGDCWDRYWVRIEEIKQSMRIVEQLIDNIPEGKTMLMKPAVKIKLPEGTYYSQVETPRGVLGVFVVSDGKDKPYRIHLRTPNFNNIWSITEMSSNWRLGDLVAMLSSLDVVVPDIDR
ncbi:MAG TPA: NADH-quinone oxidoreductase subunit D [Bdellovibrionales bacterium]|nr:MAG: NADH dehydrogenase [Bdellovibrionales bacterium GWB1_52_6]OFZ05847.1 MAG: NADH dehydrogenase [Bdellovibrionales bacterium GWA1_52_35]HAR43162.1 NADH-quinone oxidoreductase subunit D [Bdellovibrionales bacterium]